MRKQMTPVVFFLVFALLAQGCATRYEVCMETYADPTAIPYGFLPGTSFAVMPVEEDNSLFAKETTYKIGRLLLERGYRLEDCDRAEYIVFFDTGMEGFTKTEYSLRYIPGEKEKTKGKVRDSEGKKVHYEEETEKEGEFVYLPVERDYYTKQLSLAVVRNGDAIWEAEAKCTGKNDDLRYVLDYLLVSTFHYFGKDTKRSLALTLYDSDEEIQRFQQPA